MQYWRMQLHPSKSNDAMRYAVESVAAGFIGLDFKGKVGDLRREDRGKITESQQDYLAFAKKMKRGDRVLIIVHHFPFALVTVAGRYNYIARRDPQMGVWFRHFRRINRKKTRYFADRYTNARKWQPHTMTDAISPLKKETGQSYRSIESWLK